MNGYRTEATVTEDGTVIVASLPFKAGQRVEIIVLPVTGTYAGRGHERLRGMIEKYEGPFEPAVSPDDWEANRTCRQ
jgi:hypothetical protein